MDGDSHTGPMHANLFHAGSTCPFCQEAIGEGQVIVKCAGCGSLHHEPCWDHGEGCSSYHCDERVRVESGDFAADVVISAAEAEEVEVPVRAARRGTEEVVRAHLRKAPTSLSKLAVASAALGVVCLAGLLGVVTRQAPIMVLGILAGVGGIAAGVVALVIMNTGRKVYGFAPAAGGVLVSSVMIIVYLATLGSMSGAHWDGVQMEMQTAANMLTEGELERMPAAKANALRANVVIRRGGGFAGGAVYGSGIVTRIEAGEAFILTNRHVIGDADEGDIEVLLYNGEESEGEVVWRAEGDVDIAVISCEALTVSKLEPPVVASGTAAQGDAVFAIGNPMNLYWTYTEGVVSGVRRQQMEGIEIEVYQTQTPINRGNSGGGLYTMDGQLIGVNTWMRDKSVAEGLNFAISTRSILELMGEEGRSRFLK